MVDDKNILEYYNEFGGFAKDGREYEIILEDNIPPRPWINVIANETFGFTVSETGAGSTWAFNSRENKITPWSNDPVTDRSSEAIYIKNNHTNKIITPMSLGRAGHGGYRVRHGFGYSGFYHEEDEISQNLTVFTPVDNDIKIWDLTIKNVSAGYKDLAVTYYVEWVLGTDRNQTSPYIVTSFSNNDEYMYAKNVYNYDYRKYQAYIFSSEMISSYTGDRQEVLGRGGSVKYPKMMSDRLSCMTGVCLDSCGAIQVSAGLQPGETKRLVFCIGYSDDEETINKNCTKYKDLSKVDDALSDVINYWDGILGKVNVRTNDRAMDILLNGWLLYQTICCRMYARAAFYQCGGAYGFRDQLQDVLSLFHSCPEKARKQIIEASSRQFIEGDVQHWWHPPSGIGVRTKIKDDLLWLPYVTAEYISSTGDYNILHEETPYIAGALPDGKNHDLMYIPEISTEKGTIYEHCKKTIEFTKLGKRGLPLMGGGDWNDGMNNVGIEGQGESVWLGWFLYAVMDKFIPICNHMDDIEYGHELEQRMLALKNSLEKEAWDGEWYLRAFYDDDTKIGSKDSDECRIDSISQSWSVISNAAMKERTMQAMESAWKYLVLENESVSLLLNPPFNKTEKDPGYIKKYYPGIRENGGQYTHAAVWLAIAAALIGDVSKAGRLFKMLNPIYNTSNAREVLKYENEPYVMTADISYKAPYTGRGGWSWYTGSSSWMYQGLLKYYLGLYKVRDCLIIKPRVSEAFGNYSIEYRYKSSLYIINVMQMSADISAVTELTVDGAIIENGRIKLIDDGKTHHCVLRMAVSVKLV